MAVAEMVEQIKGLDEGERTELFTQVFEGMSVINVLNLVKHFEEKGDEYKLDLLENLEDGTITFYTQGDFTDLCRGPHIPHTGHVKAAKIMAIAGAYWKGDQSRQQLQRLYATAFFKEEELEQHLEHLEEAKKRDHRVLGKRLGFFHIDEMVGQGLILWAPKGAFVRQQLQDFISMHLTRQGYKQVFTPHIGKLDLYKTSGHFPYYQESQYPPIIPREQISQLAEEGCTCGELANLMKEGEIVSISINTEDGLPLSVDMPASVILEVTHTEPGVKGNTATNATKPAIVETGAKINVPLFINEGDKIKVDTVKGNYQERIKE